MSSQAPKLKQAARELRKNMTDAEKALWVRIRFKQILGLQFYRQKVLFHFIVDFYCPAASLVIECDGSQHYTKEGYRSDLIRDQALTQAGLLVLRFKNQQVHNDLDRVILTIIQAAQNNLETIKKTN